MFVLKREYMKQKVKVSMIKTDFCFNEVVSVPS